MAKLFFTPGPSQLYPTVKTHIREALENDIASISHRGKKFEEIFSQTVDNLRALLNIPQTHQVFFLSSGTEAMERVIENAVEKNSFHFINGSFSKRLFVTAQELKKESNKYEVQLGEGFNLTKVEIPGKTELLCFTHNETSTGVMTPINDIYAMKKHYPKKLIALDIVSSVPYPALDFSLLDLVFFSVQKLFGLPAGLGVIVVSPQAFEKSLYLQKKGTVIGSYHAFPTLAKFAEKNQTPETPPVLHMYLLKKVIADMLKIGIEHIREETDAKARLLYDFFDAHTSWQPFVKNKKFRSPIVISVEIGKNTVLLKKYLEENGFVVGSGYGPLKGSQIRIANFPAVSINDSKVFVQHVKQFAS